MNGHAVDADCEDAFGIALTEDGRIDRLFAGGLSEVRIDGEAVVRCGVPADLYIERNGGGYRCATVEGREVVWRDAADLMRIA